MIGVMHVNNILKSLSHNKNSVEVSCNYSICIENLFPLFSFFTLAFLTAPKIKIKIHGWGCIVLFTVETIEF